MDQSQAPAHGKFSGALKLQPIGDGVHMNVLEDFSYTDASGRFLNATPGFQTDGASIPRVLWTIVGSPFTGQYLAAAVIHDVGCVNHKYSWSTTHRLFYDAMIDSGVPENYAKLLYFGVRVGGPKWSEQTLRSRNLRDLEDQVKASGGTLSEPIVREKSSVTGVVASKNVLFTAKVTVPTSSGLLTERQLNEFKAEVDTRQASGKPISLSEIDTRTESILAPVVTKP